MTDLQEAIQILQKALREDLDYRRSWSANIAMAFKDESHRHMYQLALTPKFTFEDAVHMIANKAAENFLDLFCGLPSDG